ncbi:hypothetical protein Ahy_A04g020057 [Arachis hypogaea]|uniref:Uncharacterized protein n=1 Tax=Arachis hypogaea TaxID=3818 RepID=A0A445DH03_ARAHY|nr:hypothetical protein Ahy_A04g020057 [Arachis hypogaea]
MKESSSGVVLQSLISSGSAVLCWSAAGLLRLSPLLKDSLCCSAHPALSFASAGLIRVSFFSCWSGLVRLRFCLRLRNIMASRRLTRATASGYTPRAPTPAPAARARAPAPAPAPAPAAPAPALAAFAAPALAPAAPVPAQADPTSAPPTAPVDRRIGKRGPSRGIATNRVIKTKTNGKLELPISMENLAPNGIHADLFASEVGIVTRQNAHLDVEKWS